MVNVNLRSLRIMRSTIALITTIFLFTFVPNGLSQSTIQQLPTVRPAKPFNPTQDCAVLKAAISGPGRDSNTVIQILSQRSLIQRFELAAVYKALYGKDLYEELRREYDGKMQDVVEYLFWPLAKMYAKEFNDATRGLGTNEEALIEMTVTLTQPEIGKVAAAYQEKFGKKLEKDVRDDTSGFFRELLLALIEGRPNDNTYFAPIAPQKDAETLFTMGEGNWKNNKDTIREIFCKRPYPQLQYMLAEYERMSGGKRVEDVIENQFSRDEKKLLLGIVKCARNRADFLAESLHKAVSPVGHKDDIIIRIIVGRSEIDMGNIKEAFQMKYGKGIDQWLKNVITDYYWDLMVSLAGYEPKYYKD